MTISWSEWENAARVEGRVDERAEPHGDAVGQVTRRPTVSKRASRAKAALVAADTAAVAGALLVSAVVASLVAENDAAIEMGVLLTLLSAPVWAVAFVRRRLYAARFVTRRVEEFRRVAQAVATGVLAVIVLEWALSVEVHRGWLIFLSVTATTAVMVEREIARRVFSAYRRRGIGLRRVVIVGANAEAVDLATMLIADPGLGYAVVGFVSDVDDLAANSVGPVLGPIRETLEAVWKSRATGVIIATTALDLATSNRLVRELTEAGVQVEMSMSMVDIAPNRLLLRPLGRMPVVYVEPVRRYGWRALAKRTFDLAIALVSLIVTGPVMLVTAIAIKLDSPGPVLFRQKRVGQDGRPFTVLKFRTMVADAEARLAELALVNEADGPLFKMKDDPRVTRVGSFLRRSSLDELPQLFNVIRGDMSLVGPRPALPSEVAQWTGDVFNRLRVKPGMTGMWQVSGRSQASFEDYVRLDLYYVDNWSLVTDLVILLKTVPVVVTRSGAY